MGQTYRKLLKLLSPWPSALCVAIENKYVHVRRIGNKRVYMVSSSCPNPEEVGQAILQRRRWDRFVKVVESALILAMFALIVWLGKEAHKN